MATNIIVYSKKICPYCEYAKNFLTQKGLAFTEKRVDMDAASLQEMIQLTQGRTVPQIVINGRPIGGYDDMMALVDLGKFNELLSQ
jgi:glutaredoxin 3